MSDSSIKAESHQKGGKQIYYVVGTPLSTPETDPDIDNLRWFCDTFRRQLSLSDLGANDIFDCVIRQTDLKNITAEELRCVLKKFLINEQDSVEPYIKMNLDARRLKYHDFVKVLERNKSNGLDITFKCLSVMLRKSVIVIAEDYLWLSHQIPFKNFDLFFVMNQGGEVGAAKLWSGDVLHCDLLDIDKDKCKENAVKQIGLFDHKILNQSDAKHSQLVEIHPD